MEHETDGDNNCYHQVHLEQSPKVDKRTRKLRNQRT